MSIKVTFTVIEGEDRGRTFEITQERTIIGRSRGDVLLSDRKVSGEHLCIIVNDYQLFAEDLASTNGSFLNDERFEGKVELQNLDEISLGFSRLRVAIVEDLKQFRKANSKPPAKPKKTKQPTKKAPPKEDPVGADINALINDELKRFSRWDLVQSDPMPTLDKSLDLPKVEIYLEVIEGPEEGRKIKITKGNTVLGRGKADVKFRDNDVSRNHASIETFSSTQFFLRDLASTNGTFLNEKKVTYSKLTNGDTIQVGSTVLRFVVKNDI